MRSDFSCQIDEDSPRGPVLRLRGDLTARHAPGFRDAAIPLLAHGHLVLDFENLRFVDSSGLSALLLLRKRQPDAVIYLAATSAPVRSLVEKMQLHHIFALPTTVAEAQAEIERSTPSPEAETAAG